MQTLEFYSKGQLVWSITKKDFPPGFIDGIRKGCEQYGDFRLVIESVTETLESLNELARKGRGL